MKRKIAFFLVLLTLLTVFCLASCKKDFTVTFDSAGGTEVESQSVEDGGKATEPEAPTREGYTFAGWYSEETEWNFEENTVTSDIKLTAKWTEISQTYNVTFIADGKVVETVSFTYGTKAIKKPDVPAKLGYRGVWENFELSKQDITVNAIYTPIVYKAVFVADEVEKATIDFTVEDGEISLPEVPPKTGYTGQWEDYELGTQNIIVIKAIYTPIVYKATFVADGKEIATEEFTVEDSEIPVPDEIPPKAGYTSKWERYILTANDITIEAIYTPIQYIATFVGEGKTETRGFSVEDTDFDVPPVPKKAGYTGQWESYELGAEDITISAVYTPIVYQVTFVADGKIIATEKFTVENKQITVPDIPDKNGYTKAWDSYTLGTESITVNAIYTPIKYKATFVADGKEIATREFTVEDKEFDIPGVPYKEGYAGVWSTYVLGTEDITIEAKYTLGQYYVIFMVGQTEYGRVAFNIENMTIVEPSVPQKQCYIGEWEDYTLSLQNITVNAVYTLSHTALVNVPEASPQCNKSGNTEYWACSGCDKYFSDEQGTQEILDKGSVVIEEVDCSYVDCVCKWCGDSIHDLIHHERVEAECNKTGNVEYWYCSSCEKNFTDAEAEDEIDNIILETVPCSYVDCICKWCGDTDHKLTYYARIESQCNKAGNVEHWYCSKCEKNFTSESAESVIDNIVLEKVDCSYVNWVCKWCKDSKILSLDKYNALTGNDKEKYIAGFENSSYFVRWYQEAYKISGKPGSFDSKTDYMNGVDKTGFPTVILTLEEYGAADWRIQEKYLESFSEKSKFFKWCNEAQRIYTEEQNYEEIGGDDNIDMSN